MDANIMEKMGDSTEETTKTSVIDITETEGFDRGATKKLLRRLDWHIIPFMSLIYLSVASSCDLTNFLTVLMQAQTLLSGSNKHRKRPSR